ncbi:MAG: 16S rRNA (uracil(1498)-N(3))-methyltransferase [Gammaproteobacteria bacterium]|nr:16S rRNA (uracil(1498)-N(3))-methyltransferase [Gammaproteobacteria bacterium]
MSVPRFYCPQIPGTGMTVELPPTAAHHAMRVLRLRIGDGIAVFGGDGSECRAVISLMSHDRVSAEIQSCSGIDRESPLDITLIQAVSSGDRMDLTIRMAVELGVARIVPVIGVRSVVHLEGERARKRQRHWEEVVIAACEQCGRNRLPVVDPVAPLADWLRESPRAPVRWVLTPDATTTAHDLARPDGAVQLLVGPEGGFTDDELRAAARGGFEGIRFGPRIMRTETAAAAALAAFAALWGDF